MSWSKNADFDDMPQVEQCLLTYVLGYLLKFHYIHHTPIENRMNFLNDPNRIPQSYGLRIAIGLTVYFVVMHLVGLSHQVELRLFNLLILVAGVYLALRKLREAHEGHLHYFRALVTGVSTAAIGGFLFSIFLFVYMSIDADLMQSIQQNEPMGRYLNPYIISFIVTLEGVFSGLLVTFILINFVTTDGVNQPVN